MSKLKITGFGRFVIFLIIALPIAYFGSQYLKSSGMLDKVKEMGKDSQEEAAQDTPVDAGEDILNQINKESTSAADNEREALIAEQQRKIDELRRQNEELRKNDPVQPSTINIPPPPPPVNTPKSGSLDDLIQTAEDNMRQKGNNPNTGSSTTTASPTKSIATWAFSFSNISGTIELYEEANRLMARTAYQGTSRVDIQELTQRDERLYVSNSPTGEYYVLKSDGSLDAYDEDGFQTNCKRRK